MDAMQPQFTDWCSPATKCIYRQISATFTTVPGIIIIIIIIISF